MFETTNFEASRPGAATAADGRAMSCLLLLLHRSPFCCKLAELWRLGLNKPTIFPEAAYRGEACDLVAQPLGLDDSNLLAYSLVGVEVECEAAVVLLNDDTRSLLHGLCAHTTLRE